MFINPPAATLDVKGRASVFTFRPSIAARPPESRLSRSITVPSRPPAKPKPETRLINPIPSDRDIELWFARYPAAIAALSEQQFRPIAAWLPLIGIPAND